MRTIVNDRSYFVSVTPDYHFGISKSQSDYKVSSCAATGGLFAAPSPRIPNLNLSGPSLGLSPSHGE